MKTTNILLVALAGVPFGIQAQMSEFIHVDQFGYLNNAEKVAVLSDPQAGFNAGSSFTPGAQVDVVDMATNAIVFSGPATPWNGGALHAESGDRGWWFDFSTLNADGIYTISTNGETSAPFKIGPNIYEDVLKDAGRMFFYNRCNHAKTTPFAASGWTDGYDFANPLQDANCRFIDDPSNAALEKDLTGGWYDAGDYNKYVTFASSAVHNLLQAYEENPQAFGDDWNIPESGNGIPDILDEVKWELDWLIKMNNADGSTHIKMGSQNYSENTSSPPSANTDQRFYGPTCTSASITVAHLFAQAAHIYAAFPSMSAFTQDLETRAVASYNYWVAAFLSNSLELNCDDGSIVAGDADVDTEYQTDRGVAAAAYLYRLTGASTYSAFIQSVHMGMEQLSIPYWGAYRVEGNDALLMYANLPNSNGIASSNIISAATDAASNNWNGYFGFNSTDDLYRGFIPSWSYHWGSNNAKSNYGNLNITLFKNGVYPTAAADLERSAAELLHYFHGVNPLGMVHLSNMYHLGASKSVNEIYHTWFYDGTDFDNALTSLYGPPPGYLTGGVNPSFSVGSISPPANQPAMKSYLDFNTGWPDKSWEITEPAIYYQAAYLRLLANYVDVSLTTDVAETNAQTINVYPNPSEGLVMISGLLGLERIQISDISGRIIADERTNGPNFSVDLSGHSSGLYLISILDKKGSAIAQERVALR